MAQVLASPIYQIATAILGAGAAVYSYREAQENEARLAEAGIEADSRNRELRETSSGNSALWAIGRSRVGRGEFAFDDANNVLPVAEGEFGTLAVETTPQGRAKYYLREEAIAAIGAHEVVDIHLYGQSLRDRTEPCLLYTSPSPRDS